MTKYVLSDIPLPPFTVSIIKKFNIQYKLLIYCQNCVTIAKSCEPNEFRLNK